MRNAVLIAFSHKDCRLAFAGSARPLGNNVLVSFYRKAQWQCRLRHSLLSRFWCVRSMWGDLHVYAIQNSRLGISINRGQRLHNRRVYRRRKCRSIFLFVRISLRSSSRLPVMGCRRRLRDYMLNESSRPGAARCDWPLW
jgi:hypothetical protein